MDYEIEIGADAPQTMEKTIPARPKKESVLSGLPLAYFREKSGYHWFVVGTVCVGAFMAALDASIVNVAMPTLTSAFSGGMNTVEWVSIAYLLTLTALLTMLGSLADRLGRRMFYTLGFGVFIIGSALCGAAVSMDYLIVARVLQAIGAAMLQANSVAIITAAVSPANRGKAIGIQGAAQAIGLAVGPAVGGILIATMGWRSIFYVNVPVGIIGTALAAMILPKDIPNRLAKRFDYVGAVIFAPALVALMLALKDGYNLGWTSPTILGEFAIALVLFVVFILWEKRHPNPMVNLDLLKIPAFTGGNLSGMLSYSLMYGVLFLMPFYLEWVLKATPATAGFMLTPVPLAMVIMAPLAGSLADRMGSRALTTIGMSVASGGAVLLATLSQNTPYYVYIIGLLLVGAGLGIFTPPNNSSVMGSAPTENLGVAGGILNMARSLGMSLGVAIAGTLFGTFYSHFRVEVQQVLYDRIHAFDWSFWGLVIIGVAAALISIMRTIGNKGDSHPLEAMPLEF